MCFVGRQRKKKNTGRDQLFPLQVHQITISPKQRENKRENFCAYEKEYLVFDAPLLVLPLFFFPSLLHLLPLFTLGFFSSSFIFFFLFLVSSCFPFYTSIFFSFFFTSFLFYFFYLLASVSSLRFYLSLSLSLSLSLF